MSLLRNSSVPMFFLMMFIAASIIGVFRDALIAMIMQEEMQERRLRFHQEVAERREQEDQAAADPLARLTEEQQKERTRALIRGAVGGPEPDGPSELAGELRHIEVGRQAPDPAPDPLALALAGLGGVAFLVFGGAGAWMLFGRREPAAEPAVAESPGFTDEDVLRAMREAERTDRDR